MARTKIDLTPEQRKLGLELLAAEKRTAEHTGNVDYYSVMNYQIGVGRAFRALFPFGLDGEAQKNAALAQLQGGQNA